MSCRGLTGPVFRNGTVKSDDNLYELLNDFFSQLMVNGLPMYTQDGDTWRRKYITGGQQHVPAALPLGKTRCILDWGLDTFRGRKRVTLVDKTYMIYIYTHNIYI